MRIADCPDDRDQAGDPHPFTPQVLQWCLELLLRSEMGSHSFHGSVLGKEEEPGAGAVTLPSSLLLLTGRGLFPEPRFPLCKVDGWGW